MSNKTTWNAWFEAAERDERAIILTRIALRGLIGLIDGLDRANETDILEDGRDQRLLIGAWIEEMVLLSFRRCVVLYAGLHDTSALPISDSDNRRACALTDWSTGRWGAFMAGGHMANAEGVVFGNLDRLAYTFSDLLPIFADDLHLYQSLPNKTELFRQQLFSSTGPFHERETHFVKEHLNTFLEYLASSQEKWGFWERWYRGFLNGQPLDWDVQREIAVIPDEDWSKGAEHIAVCIGEIEARAELRKLIEEYENRYGPLEGTVGIGHNRPPADPASPEAAEPSEALTVVFDIKQEAYSPAPSGERIERLGNHLLALVGASGVVGGYMLKTGEQIANTINPHMVDLLHRIAEAALRWAEYL